MLLEDYLEKLKKNKLEEVNKPWLNKKIISENFFSDIYPDNKIEEWKFFDIRSAVNKNLKVFSNGIDKNKIGTKEFHENAIVFNNGIYDEELTKKSLKSKLNIYKLNEHEKINSSIYNKIHSDFNKYSEKRLSGYNDSKTVNLISLNAILNQGLVIEIPSDIHFDRPIQIYNHISSKQSLINPYLFVIIRDNSNIEFLDITNYSGEENWTIFFYEVYLEKNSTLKMSNLSKKQTSNINTSSYNFHLDERSCLFFSSINKGFSKKDVRVFLNGESSKSIIKGMLLSNDKETNDVFCKITHNAKNTKSDQEWRMISSGNSQTSLNGKIKILKNSKKSSGNFNSKSLLLDDKAKAFSKPELEIFEDEVKCSHGASFGEIEKEKIFYLQSRGLTKNQSIKILVLAFINELNLNDNNLKQNVFSEIENMLLKKDHEWKN